jgi:hypothetical protein
MASAVTITDNYWGGTNTYNPNNGDVIGDKKVFEVTSMDVERNAGGDLLVTVHTAFAGMAGTSKALGYGYGSLFFSTDPITLNNSSPNFGTDKYVAGRFDYAFSMPEKPGTGDQTGTGGLFALAANGSDVKLAKAPASSGRDPTIFVREGQAVKFIGNQAPVANGTWTVDSLNQTISFLINDGELLGLDFWVSWTMTCGNDVIIGHVVLPNPGPGPGPDPVPLPAGVLVFATGAAALGLLGRRRRASRP